MTTPACRRRPSRRPHRRHRAARTRRRSTGWPAPSSLADHLGEVADHLDRPLRRPGPALGRLLGRHRPQHGGEQAGRPAALRRQGPTRRPWTRARASAASPTAARAVVVRAQEAARAAGNDEIGVAHLVLGAGGRRGQHRGARRSPRRGSRSTTSVAPPPRRCRPRRARRPTWSRSTPARRRARADLPGGAAPGRREVGSGHVLLAVLEVEDGTGVLAGLGVDKATVEAQVSAA